MATAPRCSSFPAKLLLLGLISILFQVADGETIQLPGASGSGPFQVISEWATAFGALYPEATVSVSSVGSGAAQSALWGEIDCVNRPVEAICEQNSTDESIKLLESTVWGIGDSPIQESIYESQSELQLQQFPVAAGAVVVAYTKDVVDGIGSDREVDNLNFTYSLLANIFNGTLEYWDDPSIAELNPAVDLPHETIATVVRADKSGQSFIFTESIKFNEPTWPEEAVGQLPDWPVDNSTGIENFRLTCSAVEVQSNGTLHYTANGKEGVALGLLRIPYSIGYMEASYFRSISSFLEDGHLSNAANPNTFATASKDTIRASIDDLFDKFDTERLDVNLAQSTGNGTYPASGWAYWYVSLNPDSYESCYQAWLVRRFIQWSYTDPQAESIADNNGWVLPPESVCKLALERLDEMTCLKSGKIVFVRDYTPPGYEVDLNHLSGVRIIAYAMSAIVMATSVGFGTWVYINKTERVVRASQPFFLIMICVGTLVMGSAIIPATIDDSVASIKGCNLACMSFVWLVPCGFSIAFSALFSKIWRLNLLIEGARNFRRLKVKSRDVITPFVVVFGANVMILIAWTFTDPLKWIRIEIDDYNSYGVCRSENNAWKSFLGAIVLVNLLALIGANIEAYKARRICDEFSESKYIAFSMISLLQALLLGLPLAILVESSPAARTFTYTGIIFVATMSLLLLIFVPKVLFLRADRFRKREADSERTSSSDRNAGLRVRRLGDSRYRSDTESNQAQASGPKTPRILSPLRPFNTVSSMSAESNATYAYGLSNKSPHSILKSGLPKRPHSESELPGSAITTSALTEIQSRRALTEIEETAETAEKSEELKEEPTAKSVEDTLDRDLIKSIPPPRLSFSEGNKGALMVDAAGEVIQLSRRGDLTGEEKDSLYNSFSNSFSNSVSSSSAPSGFMVRVEDLPPEMANWYFRNFHS